MHSAIVSPKGTWWVPAHRLEKVWVGIAFAWCMVLFAMMPLWHFKGGQNPSGIRYRTTPAAYMARVSEFTNAYQVGEEHGMVIVAPPPGADVYLIGMQWQWMPVLKLQKGVSYTLHLSSLDVNHGFNLYPININFQVVPGYDYGLRITPNEAGDYRVVCNEFCGIGHHTMLGRIIVTDGPNGSPAPHAAAADTSRPVAARAATTGATP
jgi:cytochrome c oxidase subunit 2